MVGTSAFKRFCRELKKMSPHIKIMRLKHGFYRVYWKNAYLYEMYKEMPWKGYDITEEDPRLDSRSYYEQYEDEVKTVRTIKNYVEGYWDSIIPLKTRVWLLKHDKEFEEKAKNAYSQAYIK